MTQEQQDEQQEYLWWLGEPELREKLTALKQQESCMEEMECQI